MLWLFVANIVGGRWAVDDVDLISDAYFYLIFILFYSIEIRTCVDDYPF